MNDTLTRLMADLLRLEEKEITDTLTMEESDVWDSLKHMELIVSIEDTFNVELQPEEIVTMLSVKAIREVLNKKGIVN